MKICCQGCSRWEDVQSEGEGEESWRRQEKLIGRSYFNTCAFLSVMWCVWTFSCFKTWIAVLSAANFVSAHSNVGVLLLLYEKRFFSLWHKVYLLANMFLTRNREPWQLWQRGSAHTGDRWLSRGEEQTNILAQTETQTVFICIHI